MNNKIESLLNSQKAKAKLKKLARDAGIDQIDALEQCILKTTILNNHCNKESMTLTQYKIITDEIRFVEKIISGAESMYAGWEKWYLTLNIALISVLKILFDKNSDDFPIILFALVGLAFANVFENIQIGNHKYALMRLGYWRELENRLKTVSQEIIGLDHQYLITYQYKKHKEIEKESGKAKFTTWQARKKYPEIFGLFWVAFLLIELYKPIFGFGQ